jgi:hypothetical protein
LQEGRRLALPLTGDLQSENEVRMALHVKHGVDPMDIEAMLERAIPRP